MPTATTKTKLPAFVVSKKGLAKLLERKGKSFAVIELLQNAWDEVVTRVDVTLERVNGNHWKLVVEDDNPEGFKDLSHAYTLFADSLKKGDPTKRGRFNLGEKLVIALCDKAIIQTTKGTIVFEGDHRAHSSKTRESGSSFTGLLRLTAAEVAEIEAVVKSLLPPHNIETTFNLKDVPSRKPLRTFDATLRTEIADEEGRLKPTTRKTTIEVYVPAASEQASIYELGIPVVPTGDRWHVNVGQKVPLPTDRDNVPPGYLRDVRVAVLNACYDLLPPEDAKATWVTNAIEDEAATEQAIKHVFKLRFGDKAVIFDPNDPEANNRAMAEGYTVVPGGALPKNAWKQVKVAGVVKPAGQVTPSPSAEYAKAEAGAKMMDPEHWPLSVCNVVEFAKALSLRLTGAELQVSICNDTKVAANATYTRRGPTSGSLMLNLGRLGYKWFEQPGENTLDLLLDEFAHHYADNHLDTRYYRALRTLGAKMTILALNDPAFYEQYGFQIVAASV